MIDKIPAFLKDQFNNKAPKPSKFPNEIKEFMLNYAAFYNFDTINLVTIFKAIKKNISTLGICELPNCNNTKKLTVYGDITSGCCKKHSTLIHNLLNYGYENVNQVLEFKEKRKSTCLKRYGHEYITQTDLFKEKSKETCLERYGHEYAFQNIDIQRKAQNTMMNNHGVRFTAESKELQQKMQKTMLDRYGIRFTAESPILFNKMKKTVFNKYGVQSILHVPVFFEKQQNNTFKRKEYIWETGECSLVQGYEPIILKELELKGYTYNDIITDAKSMPCIWYYLNNKKHRYYPDIFIPKENLIIEVKSTYTIKCNVEKNKAKFKAVIDAGYKFKLEVR